jgi:hypothetical protein
MARGHGILRAAADTEIELTRPGGVVIGGGKKLTLPPDTGP